VQFCRKLYKQEMQLQKLLLGLYKRLQQLRVYFEASGKK
jgi:hypothetical protein